MRFPSIKRIARALREENRGIYPLDLKDNPEDEQSVDIRLQVYENGSWAIRVGSSDYDQDHRGYWGCSCLNGKRFNSSRMARELLNQAKEQCYSL